MLGEHEEMLVKQKVIFFSPSQLLHLPLGTPSIIKNEVLGYAPSYKWDVLQIVTSYTRYMVAIRDPRMFLFLRGENVNDSSLSVMFVIFSILPPSWENK